MGIYNQFDSMVQFVVESVARLFSPTDDAYPIIGVQPFSGQPFHKTKKFNW
jgi:hypothetical protein